MEVFNQITGLLLSYVADAMPTKLVSEGETLNLDGEIANFFLIIRSGKLNYYENGELVKEMSEKNFIGENIDNQQLRNSRLLVALEDSNILLLSKDRYYELLSDNLHFAQTVIRYMTA